MATDNTIQLMVNKVTRIIRTGDMLTVSLFGDRFKFSVGARGHLNAVTYEEILPSVC